MLKLVYSETICFKVHFHKRLTLIFWYKDTLTNEPVEHLINREVL